MGNTNRPVDLTLTAGLPYRRRIRVTGAARIWPTREEFEVRSQVRVDQDVTSRLKTNLSPHLSASIDGDDIVVEMSLTGRETRLVASGYYDMIISDVGPEDARAIPILAGQIKIKQLTTAAADV